MTSYNDDILKKRTIQAFYEEIAPYVVPEEFMEALCHTSEVSWAITGSTILKCIMKALDMDVSTEWNGADIDIYIKVPPLLDLEDDDCPDKYLKMAKFLKLNGFTKMSSTWKHKAQYHSTRNINIELIQDFEKNDKVFQLIYVSLNKYVEECGYNDIHYVIEDFDFDIIKNVLYNTPSNSLSSNTTSILDSNATKGSEISLKITNLESIQSKYCAFDIGGSKRLANSYDRRDRYIKRGFEIDFDGFRDEFLQEYIFSEQCPFFVYYIQFPLFSVNALTEGLDGIEKVEEPFNWKMANPRSYQCHAKKYKSKRQRITYSSNALEEAASTEGINWHEIEPLVATEEPYGMSANSICFFHIYDIKHVHCYTTKKEEIIVLEDVPTKWCC